MVFVLRCGFFFLRGFLLSMFGYKFLFHCYGASFAFLLGILHQRACQFHVFGSGFAQSAA